MSRYYSIEKYDKYLSLKFSPVMWLIVLFLLRPYIIFFASIANRSDRMMLINLFYSDKLPLSLGAFAGIPAALLVYAWTRRRPGAPDFVKRLWHKGRILLSVSALLNGAIVFVPLWLGVGHRITAYGWGQLAASLLILVVVYRSRYMRDCFADFPEGEDADVSGRKKGA